VAGVTAGPAGHSPPITSSVIGGVTNKGLRAQVAGLLGTDYTRAQMTYDLRRLRLIGLITPAPAQQHLRPDQ